VVAFSAPLVFKRRARQRWLPVAVAVLVPLLLATLVGLVIGLGSTALTLGTVAMVAGLALLFVPTFAIVYVLLGLAIAGAGTLMYYAGVSQAHWLPYALSLFLWFKLPLDSLAKVPERHQAHGASAGLPMLGYLLIGLFVVMLCSALVNGTSLPSALVGARNYVYIWSIAFVVAAGSLTPAQLRTTICWLLALVVLQLPFAAQQHFVAFGQTGNWDAIVGTFGGNPNGGGGGSGYMVLFLCFGLALAAALWKHGQLRGGVASLVILATTAATMLAETKAFFIFAPVALAVIMLSELRRRPALALSMMAVGGALLAATLVFYKYAYFDSSATAKRDASLADYFEYTISADSKTKDMINPETGEVSRMGAPLIWLHEGGVGGPHGWWVGYGPRASNTSQLLGKGEAAKHFSFNLTTSSLTTLLWDVGVLGLGLFVSVLVAGAVGAWRLSRLDSIPVFHRASLEAMVGVFSVALASLLYNSALIDGCAIQAFMAFAVGYVMYWQKSEKSVALVRA
jgi:hypothetical protein